MFIISKFYSFFTLTLIYSIIFVLKSITPDIGFVNNPIAPFKDPIGIPIKPLLLNSKIGC